MKVAALTLAWFLMANSDSGSGSGSAPKAAAFDEQKAIASFRQELKRVQVREPPGQKSGWLAAQVANPPLPARASVGKCREKFAQLNDALGPTEGKLVLYGERSSLDRPGECWEVTIGVTVWNQLIGYLDPKSGTLLLAWFTPEG
jgi:hypothetical protein